MAAMEDAQAKEVWLQTWTCSNALDRDWIRKRLKEDKHHDCKLMFIELELTDPELIRQHVAAAKPAAAKPAAAKPAAARPAAARPAKPTPAPRAPAAATPAAAPPATGSTSLDATIGAIRSAVGRGASFESVVERRGERVTLSVPPLPSSSASRAPPRLEHLPTPPDSFRLLPTPSDSFRLLLIPSDSS